LSLERDNLLYIRDEQDIFATTNQIHTFSVLIYKFPFMGSYKYIITERCKSPKGGPALI